ncbi:7 transmembrane receptor (rhodopsin family) domain-containing protein [Phthorimaea operculella]|nr:7 transmembrane receptor (rhodopsin family) domain-containing protein [Phthorimaea operculella]
MTDHNTSSETYYDDSNYTYTYFEVVNQTLAARIFIYVTYVTTCLSAWLVVAFTVERFVAVLYPLQRNAICTVKRARHIILSIVLAALLLNVPVLRFAKASQHQCSIDYEYLDDAERFNLVDTIVTLLVPLTVIIIMNTWIMIGVCRLERVRLMLRTAPARPPACPRSQQRVTRMLLLVSSVFVVLNMPAYVVRIIAYAKDISGAGHEDGEQWMSTLQQLSIMFFNTNFGINFILYCLSGQNFRRALRQTMPWLRKRKRRGVAVRRPTSCHPARASSVSTSGRKVMSTFPKEGPTILWNSEMQPLADERKAGRETADIFRIPMPPKRIGSDAWDHASGVPFGCSVKTYSSFVDRSLILLQKL